MAMTTYIPTVLLVLKSYATSFCQRDLFKTVIDVNLTCMLVLGKNFVRIVLSNLQQKLLTKHLHMMIAHHKELEEDIQVNKAGRRAKKDLLLKLSLYLRHFVIPALFIVFPIVYRVVGIIANI